MDMITLAMAKAYSDSKGDYVKPGEVIAFDGNTNGKEIFADTDMGLSLVKVSDKFYDLSKVNRIVSTDTATGEKLDIQFSAFTENGESLAGGFAGETYVISTDGTGDNMGFLTPGTWVFLEKGIYISRIEFAETIVPIDQKYLPGVCLPVVELSTTLPVDGTETALSEAECAALSALNGMPCIIKGASEAVYFTSTAIYLNVGGLHYYSVNLPMVGHYAFISNDNVNWTCAFTEVS